MQTGILGRIKYDAENSSGVLTAEKKKLLKNYGIKNWDFSHYAKGRFDLISKKKLPIMRKIIHSEIVSAKDFIPLNSGTKLKATTVIIERGIK